MEHARIGLALGGGAARGWAHLGVLESLAEIGIKPDIVAGTSIGALAGGCFLSGHFKQLEHWACSLTRLRMLRFMESMPFSRHKKERISPEWFEPASNLDAWATPTMRWSK